jgi:uncharacterized protein YbjT (DUF2867 family)
MESPSGHAALTVLVTGATGLIGAAVVARLAEHGHVPVAAVRRAGRTSRRLPAGRTVTVDIGPRTRAEHWLPHLAGVDAVVNCAGVLQRGPGDSPAAVHERGAAALFEACARAGVRRVVHLSAIGVDRGALSEFSRSKLAGDEALRASELDWVILRPSVVLGEPAFGGSALVRGLAALPLLPEMPEAGPLQVVQLEDVVRTVLFFLNPAAPARVAVELAGPDRLGLSQVVAEHRRWLGLKPARTVRLPRALAALAYRAGDLLGALGWRPPIRSTARREMVRGAVGDPGRWIELTGIRPLSLRRALARRPASVQEQWFARLYFLKPLLLAVLALFWVATGLISLGPGYDIGITLMTIAGAGGLAGASVVAGAVADILVGLGIAWRRTARPALWAGIGLSLFYAVAGSLLLPVLWIEPLGPMLKIWPILAAMFVALAILEDR